MRTDRADATQSEAWPRSESAMAHVERVLTIAEGRESAPTDAEVAGSWRRSANVYHVNPDSKEAPRILTNTELTVLREPLAKLIVDARDELDHLYEIVQRAAYTVLLCNNQGTAVDHRGDEAEADQFKYWGTWLGGVWGEEVEGTNGIGTCIAEKRPVTVHRSQHFRARHISLSCSGAPIFDPQGELIAVLDVSSIDPRLSEASHALTGALTEVSARAIEERCFREAFRDAWIVAVSALGAGAGMLIAVNRDHQIIGADRHARAMLARKNLKIENGVIVWALFERNPTLFRSKDRGDFAALLVPAGTVDSWPGLITPPEARWQKPEISRLHSRPRLHAVGGFQLWAPIPRAGGGLSPGALRRTKDYIDANLEKNVSLATLADAAGLSVFHFARAFRQSEGTTPHAYLLERRIEQARKLLADSDLSLSDIARASGFSDQSHLARLFRQRLGISPTEFRRSLR